MADFVDLSSWPEWTRLIVRRERAHPGAQLSLFDDIEGRGHTAFITNQDGDAPVLELAHRQRGATENVIRDLKACGYKNWPSEDIVTGWAMPWPPQARHRSGNAHASSAQRRQSTRWASTMAR